MNFKNYFVISLSVLILVPTIAFSMDQKDSDQAEQKRAQAQLSNNSNSQPSAPASASQPAAQPPFQAVNPSQPQPASRPFRALQPDEQPDARDGSELDAEAEEYFNFVNNAPRGQALPAQQPNNHYWSTIKKLAATGTGCLVGAFCGTLIKKMWIDLYTGGLLELPATIILGFATHDFADSIGGSAPLADIAMILAAMEAQPYSAPGKNIKKPGGIYIRGGGVIVA